MPDQFERHARSSQDDWGTTGSRSEQRRLAAQDDPLHASVPGRKDPAHCKTLQGPHCYALFLEGRWGECGWKPVWIPRKQDYGPVYRCYHSERCEGCGKVKGGWLKDVTRCLTYSPDVPRGVLADVVLYRKRRASWKPVRKLKKKEGYRKPKSG